MIIFLLEGLRKLNKKGVENMRIFYICSPYRGEIERNVSYAKELSRDVLLHGDCVITPHLYITQCLNDQNPSERLIGCTAALELLAKCDGVIVGERFGISPGMEAEIKQAKQLNIPVYYR